jgi:transposase-like protein
LRKRRPKPCSTWHLDEVYLKIGGRLVYLWRAVDAEGEILDVLVQAKRNKHAAVKLMRKLLKKYGFVPDRLITDDLRSYGAAARDLGIEKHHERGRWKNNRAENSHQPRRRRDDLGPGLGNAVARAAGRDPTVIPDPACCPHRPTRRVAPSPRPRQRRAARSHGA